MDMQVEALKQANVMAAGFSGVMNKGKMKQYFADSSDRLRVMTSLMEYDTKTASNKGMKDVDATLKLYHALEKSGILDKKYT
jgi:hypothetical protein